jgi:hypothetical protein
MIETGSTHVVLFQFVPAEDYKLSRAIVPQHDFNKSLTKRARSPGDQDNLLRPIHPMNLKELPSVIHCSQTQRHLEKQPSQQISDYCTTRVIGMVCVNDPEVAETVMV